MNYQRNPFILLPQKWQPYVQLIRADRLVGVWLLFFPGAWAILLGSSKIEWMKLGFFLGGAFIARSLGCTWNDLVDQDVDRQVKRTLCRPLARRALTSRQALGVMLVLAALGLGLFALFYGQMSQSMILLGTFSIVMSVIYPFLKRITFLPQFFLGLIYAWGALMGWLAVRGALEWQTGWLYIGSVCWVVAYDTVYAYQDVSCDRKAGVKSLALFLEERGSAKLFIGLCYSLFVVFFFLASGKSFLGLNLIDEIFLLAWIFYRLFRLDLGRSEDCAQFFLFNRSLGFFIMSSLMFEKLLVYFGGSSWLK